MGDFKVTVRTPKFELGVEVPVVLFGKGDPSMFDLAGMLQTKKPAGELEDNSSKGKKKSKKEKSASQAEDKLTITSGLLFLTALGLSVMKNNS